MKTTEQAVEFFPTTGQVVRIPLMGNDEADLMKRDARGQPTLEIPERGNWPTLIRSLQDSRIALGEPASIAATDTDLHKGCGWWTHGSKGRVGVGGWQKQFPFASIKAFYEALGYKFPTVAALFADDSLAEFYALDIPEPETLVEPLRETLFDEEESIGERRLITSALVAAKLGCSQTKVLVLAKTGELRAERTATGIYIFEEDVVDEFARERWPDIRPRRK